MFCAKGAVVVDKDASGLCLLAGPRRPAGLAWGGASRLECGLFSLPPLTLNSDCRKGSGQETEGNLTVKGWSKLLLKKQLYWGIFKSVPFDKLWHTYTPVKPSPQSRHWTPLSPPDVCLTMLFITLAESWATWGIWMTVALLTLSLS